MDKEKACPVQQISLYLVSYEWLVTQVRHSYCDCSSIIATSFLGSLKNATSVISSQRSLDALCVWCGWNYNKQLQ